MIFSPATLLKALLRREQPERLQATSQRRRAAYASAVMDILESRTLLSVSATGAAVSSAKFFDANGDAVTITITGNLSTSAKAKATFVVNLDGGVTDMADVESITVNGAPNAVLSIRVTPVKFKLSTAANPISSPGIMDVQEINATASTTTLRGISGAGTALDFINLPGVTITSLSLNPGQAPQVDKLNATHGGYNDGFNQPQAGQADFGIIDAANIGTLSITGIRSVDFAGNADGSPAGLDRTDGNDFVGPVSVTGNIGKVLGNNATITDTAPFTVGGTIGLINVYGIHTTINANVLSRLQAQELGTAQITTQGGNLFFNNTTSQVFSITAGGNVDFGSSVAFNGTITAQGIISGLAPGTTDAIFINTNTNESDGTLQAGVNGTIATGTAAITNITINGTGGFGGVLEAVSGDIGIVTADHLDGATVNAQVGNLDGFAINSAANGTSGVSDSTIHAGGTLGPVSVRVLAVGNTAAVLDSSFRADGSIVGPITLVGPIGDEGSIFSTPGAITGLVTVTSTKGSTGNAILDDDTNFFNTGFSAGGTVAAGFQVNGSIASEGGPVLFLAGYDVGPDGLLGTGDDTLGAATAVSLTKINVTGSVHDAVFAAGVDPVNGTFGDGDDVLNGVGSTLVAAANPVTIGGDVIGSVFESGDAFSAGLTANHRFQNNVIRAFTSNIGTIVVSGSIPGDDIFSNNTIKADLGSVGDITVTNTSTGGDDAIDGGSVTAGTSVGKITGTTAGTGTGIDGLTVTAGTSVDNMAGTTTLTTGNGDGISDVTVTAGTTIGTVTGTAAGTGNGIDDSTFTGASIGNLSGSTTNATTGGEGISDSLFRATAGAIGTISATVANPASDAIDDSGFNAFGSIGATTTTGDIDDSVWIAGVNLGGNFSANGASGPPSSSMGFNLASTTGANADVQNTVATSVGAITLSAVPGALASGPGNGKITDSTISAGLTSLGANNSFDPIGTTGANADTNVAGSTVGLITAPGGIDPVFVVGGSIAGATVSNGTISGSTFNAVDATGTGIGAITATLTSTATTQDPNVISNDTFNSITSIGNVSGTLNGVVGAGNVTGNYGGIIETDLNAKGAVGSVTGVNNATDTVAGDDAYGIWTTNVLAGNDFGTAGTATAGGIGAISGTVTTISPQSFSAGIFNSTFDASNGTTATGNITSITASNTGTGADNEGVLFGTFRARGTVGPTVASAVAGQEAIDDSIVSGSGALGTITVSSGDVIGTNFLSGDLIAAGSTSVDAGTVGTAGGSIGNVSITGHFEGSDLVASITPAGGFASGFFGASGDASVGVGGTIGTVTISLPAAPVNAASGGTLTNAIEAKTLGVVTWGGTVIPQAGAGSDVDANGNASATNVGTDVRVRGGI